MKRERAVYQCILSAVVPEQMEHTICLLHMDKHISEGIFDGIRYIFRGPCDGLKVAYLSKCNNDHIEDNDMRWHVL